MESRGKCIYFIDLLYLLNRINFKCGIMIEEGCLGLPIHNIWDGEEKDEGTGKCSTSANGNLIEL